MTYFVPFRPLRRREAIVSALAGWYLFPSYFSTRWAIGARLALLKLLLFTFAGSLTAQEYFFAKPQGTAVFEQGGSFEFQTGSSPIVIKRSGSLAEAASVVVIVRDADTAGISLWRGTVLTQLTVTFEPGQSESATNFAVISRVNDIAQGFSTWYLDLVSPSVGTIGADSTFPVEVWDLDSSQMVTMQALVGNSSPQTVREGESISYVVTRSGPTDKAVEFPLSSSFGGGLSEDDFLPGGRPTSVKMGIGISQVTVTFRLAADGIVDAGESYMVHLGIPAGYVPGTPPAPYLPSGTSPNQFYTIDPPSSDLREVTVSDASVIEGNVGQQTLVFPVSIPTPASVDLRLGWIVSSQGSAQVGADFISGSGSVVIPAGQTTTSFSLEVLGDTLHESDETIVVILESNPLVQLTKTSVLGVITNDDAAPILTVENTVVTEGLGLETYAWFKLTLSKATGRTSTVHYASAPGSAKEGTDYERTRGTLSFLPGEREKWLRVRVFSDAEGELAEAFTLQVSDPVGLELSSPQATAAVHDTRISDFFPVADFFVIKFQSGLGQTYVVEEFNGTSRTWTPITAVLIGSGAIVNQIVYPSGQFSFYRVRATVLPPGTAAN